jgi:hypothetical protein
MSWSANERSPRGAKVRFAQVYEGERGSGVQRGPIRNENIKREVHHSSQSQSHITTEGQSVSVSWCQAQSGTFDQRSFFFFKVTVLSLWSALSDERSGLSFVSPCQYSL